jgi:peptidoglycan hydrolase-like protein with peptidoglycan-binding domain
MANEGLPTIQAGASGDPVRHLQRALRRTPNPAVVVDGAFGPSTEAAVKDVQQASGLAVDGVAGPRTWAAIPDGGPMPRLARGSAGQAVTRLQQVLTDGAPDHWSVTPQGVDGKFGPRTLASVEAFQQFAAVTVDGVVGDRTWSVPLHTGEDLERAVGLDQAG